MTHVKIQKLICDCDGCSTERTLSTMYGFGDTGEWVCNETGDFCSRECWNKYKEKYNI